MNDRSKKLLDELLQDYKSPKDILGEEGLLKQLTKAVVERALSSEMTEHLGYSKNDPKGHKSGNSRNGSTTKKLTTDLGDIDLTVPRDRNGKFTPQIVRKGQRRIDGFDDKIIALYARGMSTRDIQSQLQELYGASVSPELISRVTDGIVDAMQQWQNRPLERLYTIVYLDALWIKVRHQGRVLKKAVYLAIGINEEGIRSVLGFWIHVGEGAASWMNVIAELQHRGVEDILIACVDGLKGLPEAVGAIFPKTEVQLCVVHMIRNSLKYVSFKDRQKLATDLRYVYNAVNEKEGSRSLSELENKWSKYPQVAALWKRNWEHVAPMFHYPQVVRKMIYTTNAIEALNSALRRPIRNKGSFPTDQAAAKLVYLALMKHKGEGWKKPVNGWDEARNQLAIIFEERMTGIEIINNPFTQKS